MNGAEDAMLERAKTALRKRIELERQSMLHELTYNIMNMLNKGVSGAIVKGIVGYAIFSGTGSVGLMTMSIMYVSRIEDFFSYLVYIIPQFRSFSDSVRKFEIFLSIAAHGETLKQEKFQEEIEAVRIKRLTFRYPKMVQEELQFINIAIDRIKQYSSKADDQDLDELHMLENLRKEAEHPSPIVLRNITIEFRK
jgi:ABC-type bacteriocin/lantibiotic exporter with double-glycine peptidase domain